MPTLGVFNKGIKMARVRKFVAYRSVERPYTRKSKYRKKNFVRAAPVSKVVRYNMGNINKKFDYRPFYQLLLNNKLSTFRFSERCWDK